jgi:ribosomal protein S27AE
MRRNVVIGGIVIITIGVALYFFGKALYDNSYANYMYAQIPSISWNNLLNPTVVQHDPTPYKTGMEIGQSMVGIGIIFLFIGAPMTAIGAVIKEDKLEYLAPTRNKEEENQKTYQDDKREEFLSTTKFCPRCGVELEGNPYFCFKCGYKLR